MMTSSTTENSALVEELRAVLNGEDAAPEGDPETWKVVRDVQGRVKIEKTIGAGQSTEVADASGAADAGSLARVLAKFGLDQYLGDILAEIQKRLQASQIGAHEPVSESAIDYLVRSARTVPEVYEGWKDAGPEDRKEMIALASERGEHGRVSDAAAGAMSLLSSSLSQQETAELLRVDKSNVSRQGRSGKLFVADFGGSKRYPLWQFERRTRLPNLSPVVHAMSDAGFDPLSVENFMQTERGELDGRSPREHLLRGGSPNTVVTLIEGWSHR